MNKDSIWFDGFVWELTAGKTYAAYIANVGSVRHPKPRNLTRHVWERAHGVPDAGYRIEPIDGDYKNWHLENLRLVMHEDRISNDLALRRYRFCRGSFIAACVADGMDADDAWDLWLLMDRREREELTALI